MIIRSKYNFILLLAILMSILFLSSCKISDFEVKDFNPLSNYDTKKDGIKTILMDYDDAIDSGFVIPSVKQTKGGKFAFRFSIKCLSGKPQKFYYKIYYQNESYKFQETKQDIHVIKQDSLAEENFYGSWEDVNKTFLPTKEIPADDKFYTIEDSFRIVGNPRNEQKYYGPDEDRVIPETKITEMIEYIKTDIKWYANIVTGAKKYHRTIEAQMHREADFVIGQTWRKSIINKRWQRNPRVGKYSFILVIASENDLKQKKIPEFVQNISKKNGNNFENPYYFFLHKKDNNISSKQIVISTDTLKIIAKPDLGKGIFIGNKFFNDSILARAKKNKNCGHDPFYYRSSAFEQYSHYIDPRFPLENIPVKADVQGGEYTMKDYLKNTFPDNKIIKVPVSNTDCPCNTVYSDSLKHSLKLTNPASPPNEWRKENVGVISRHGFTYGKFRCKVKLPQLLNKTQLWNGITNAIWLLYQQDAPWDYRRFAKQGYIPKDENSEKHLRKQNLAYSEIDFEMIKAAHYWPKTSYPKAKIIPIETPADSDKVMVTYTNWDMACWDVPHFTMGADSILYQGNYFGIHRWDQYYRALTGKYPAKDDEIFGKDYYYFEIEWKPKEIIWRIGPEKDKLKVVGYVNDVVSSIPNNQMLLLITQEFHHSKWWPNAPFSQDRIPFLAKDIIGEVYDLEIE